MSEPDVGMGFIYGWRQFDVTVDGYLMSPFKATLWPVDPTPRAATCKLGPWLSRTRADDNPHTIVPDLYCSCGWYCYSSNSHGWLNAFGWGGEYYSPPSAIALCRAWGGIVLHSNGFRSQYLAIDQLWMDANATTRSKTRNLYRTFRVKNAEDFEERKSKLNKLTTNAALKDIIWIPTAEADLAAYDGPRSNRAAKLRANKKAKQVAKRKNLNPGSSQKKIAPREQDPKTKWWW